MTDQNLLNKLEKDFAQIQKEFGLKISLDELDEIFSIKDFILREGYVGTNLLRQISSRIIEVYAGWGNYLHSIILPNPQNIFNMSESKVFDQGEKKEITDIMKKLMAISSMNSVLSLRNDKKKEAEFIGKSVSLWNDFLKEKLIKIMGKIQEEWEK